MSRTGSEPIRLNKLVAQRCGYSRREADTLIQQGVVTVDGKNVTNPAQLYSDMVELTVRGRRFDRKKDFYTAIVYHKPKGELVGKSDPRGRKTIFDSLPLEFKKFIPVGRLDYASEGLLILTDSAAVATKLMNSDLERTYNIKIHGDISPSIEKAMLEGIELKHSKVGAHEKSAPVDMQIGPFVAYKIVKNAPTFSKLSVKITEGKNRELRRFFAFFKREVADLKRVSYGFVSLNALPCGKNRYFTKKEYQELKDFMRQEEIHAQKNRL